MTHRDLFWGLLAAVVLAMIGGSLAVVVFCGGG